MRWRNVVAAIVLSVLSAIGATAAYVRASRLRVEAQQLLAEADAQAAEYSKSRDARRVEAQLATSEKRRAMLIQAYFWQRVQILLILLSVAAAMSCYLLYLYARLLRQLDEVQVLEFYDPGQGGASDQPPKKRN